MCVRCWACRCWPYMVVLLFWTAPNRWGAGIALHYLSRVSLAGPRGSNPAASCDRRTAVTGSLRGVEGVQPLKIDPDLASGYRGLGLEPERVR